MRLEIAILLHNSSPRAIGPRGYFLDKVVNPYEKRQIGRFLYGKEM